MGIPALTLPQPALPVQLSETRYTFGPFKLLADGTLLRGSVSIALPPKELAVLRLLVRHAGRIVSSAQLRQNVWGDVHVSSASLPRSVSSLRAHLKLKNCIETIYKRGYRFQIPVHPATPPARLVSLVHRAAPMQELRPELPSGPRLSTNAELPRLAVLPLEVRGGLPESLGAELAGQTILALANQSTPAVELLARDSVLHLAARGISAWEVASALHAGLVLTGTVTPLLVHLRVRVEMIRVADSVQLWVEDFLISCMEPDNIGILAARRIADRIRATVTPESSTLGPRAETGFRNQSTDIPPSKPI